MKNRNVIISLMSSGISFSRNEPKVDPSRLQGMMIRMISKSIKEVFLRGCFLKIALITFGRAAPATVGWMSAVEREESNLSRFIITITLKSPMDLPATLTKPAPMGISK